MPCLRPVLVQDKSTGGVMYVKCGRCMSCRIQRARMWALRITHECRDYTENIFVTLTYSPEYIPKNNSLVKHHAQDFFRKLRRITGRKVRYFLGAEYGDRGFRPHYHICLFGWSVSDRATLEQAWPWGFIHIGGLTFDSACYVASYTLKKLSGENKIQYENRGVIPEFSLMSRKPGIGANYCERNKKFLKENVCCISKGSKVTLPRFYRDRIFTGDDKNIIHALAQDFNQEKFEKTKAQAQAHEGFQVIDYQKGQRIQHGADLLARQGLKKRKL